MVFDAAGSRKTPTREASCGVRDVPGVRGKPEDPTREAFRLVKKLGLPGLAVNLDVGTMIANGEHPEDFALDMKYVSHIHISEPGLGAIQPRPIHRQLALLLGAVGYRGFVSVEMKAQDPDTLTACLEYVKEVFGEV